MATKRAKPTSKTAGKRSPKSAPATKRAAKSGKQSDADWDAAKDILSAHRTLARAERRESDLTANLKTHAKQLRSMDRTTAQLRKQLDTAAGELSEVKRSRKKVAAKLRKLETAT